jgi:translation initiation factor IF-2
VVGCTFLLHATLKRISHLPMFSVNDKQVKKGLPSQPVRIVGFKTIPKAGDALVCVASEQVADDLVERRKALKNKDLTVSDDPNSPFSQVIISGRESMTSTGTERRLQRYDLAMEDTGPIRIPIVVKAKADGSVAAVRDALKMLGKESSFDINVDPIAEGVGMLTRGEIEMAKESNAAVFCFDVKTQDKTVMNLAEAEGVAVHEFDVIYSLLDQAKEVFTQYLPPVQFETTHGKATVQAVFSINNDKDRVAGLRVLDGNIYKSSVNGDKKSPVSFRVIRDGERISPEGDQIRATSLKKFKDDVESVRHGEECGLSLTGDIDFKEGDVIECYSIEMRKAFSKK